MPRQLDCEDDTSRFFGRNTELDELVCRLQRGDRAIYIIGASGSGKSSLIAAGLLPRLSRGVSGLPCFHIHTLRPGEQPMSQLADALDGDPTTPVAAIDGLLAQHTPATSFLLVVDQLEELFASASADQRAGFFAAIRALRSDPRCVLVFTLRSDFYGALLECPLWTDIDGRISRIELGAMRGDNLRTVIECPARDAGVHVQPELVSRLLADAACEPGALRRRERSLSLADYQALGDCGRTGLAFAVSEHARDALAALSEEREVIAFRILLRLVQFGEGRADTRRQQPLAALRSDDEDPADFDAVLRRLVEHRLVTVIGDKHGPVRVDLAHEILLTAWPMLVRWIRVWRTAELRRRELEAAAAAWRLRGSGIGGLLDAGELAAAIAWRDRAAAQLGQTPDLAAFLAASHAAHRRASQQRRHRTWCVFAAVALFATVTSTLAVVARRSANEADRERVLVVEQSRQIVDGNRDHRRSLGALHVTIAQLLFAYQHPLEAARLLLEAAVLGDSRTPSTSLRTSFAQAARGLPILGLEHDAEVTCAAFSTDGTRVVTASTDGTVRTWDAATGRPLVAAFHHPGRVNSVAFSPDGLRIVTAGTDHTARIWDARSGQLLLPTLSHRAAVTHAEFSSDGARIVTASEDNTARIWDATFGAPLTPPLPSRDRTVKLWDATSGKLLAPPLRHEDAVNYAALSPDGARIVTASGRGAWIWDVESGKQIATVMTHPGVVMASFSRDGHRIVTASNDGTARIWSATSSQEVSPPLHHRGSVNAAVFSVDGTRVVTACADHRARIWDSRPDAPLLPPLTHQYWVQSGAFSPDGALVATASFDHTARIWNATTGAPVSPPLQHQKPVNHVAFSPDGSRVVTASADDTARIWDVATGVPLSPPLRHADEIVTARFSPDGRRVVTASGDGTARVWDVASGTPVFPALRHHARVTSAVFSPDGTRVVTTSPKSSDSWA
ncbi:MAG: hypothetical protein E6J90_52500 [Deltaproteobacteria bacterium]|nr:MAG: hypothetical protein E6J90_52500 [Deltaproteobacteria bacterium]